MTDHHTEPFDLHAIPHDSGDPHARVLRQPLSRFILPVIDAVDAVDAGGLALQRFRLAASAAAQVLVMRAIEHVHATLTEDVGRDDIGMAVGARRRTLVRHCRSRRVISPMTLRRRLRLRLRRAHEELLGCDPARVRVMYAVYRRGFFNLGHLAGLYRRVLDCTPSRAPRVGAASA